MRSDPPPEWKAAVDTAFAGAARIAVCGIGNDLRGDDAAGLLCLRRLDQARQKRRGAGRRAVAYFDCGETPENETGRIRSFRPDLVVLIDAVRGGHAPGDVFVLFPDRIADEEVSTHRISLGLLIRYVKESIGADVLFLGVEPESTETGRAASRAIKSAASAVAAYLYKRL